jgi:hypothetical protein
MCARSGPYQVIANKCFTGAIKETVNIYLWLTMAFLRASYRFAALTSSSKSHKGLP